MYCIPGKGSVLTNYVATSLCEICQFRALLRLVDYTTLLLSGSSCQLCAGYVCACACGACLCAVCVCVEVCGGDVFDCICVYVTGAYLYIL